MLEKAYKIAYNAHEGQKRKSGEDYIIHPLCTALILADLELDKETIVSGLLHDVVEDTEVDLATLEKEFSPEVAVLVDGVTKLTQLSYDVDKVDRQAENLRKMFLAMAKDIRVVMIKLADRLHNMRTLQYMTPQKQKEKSRETMEIYAPLAQRLGISKVKIELDDLALKYLEPEAYKDLVEKVSLRKKEREDYVGFLVGEVRKAVKDAGISATVEGRAKHIFSIYKKMVNQHKTIDQIYDLFAVRIIVDDIKDCYAALGVMHEKYTPIPGRFKDYIAMPKPNMYQSLHTTLIGPKGSPFEIQIRTYEMHKISEYGIAAHWKYKEGGEGSTINKEEAKLSWLRQILEWQQDMSDNKEFMSVLKSDFNLFGDTVFCFTPSGDVKNLPAGSTAIDFAYSIHSAVGNKMVGAKVNGKLVPIDYEIKTGDRIEILTSQNSKGPSTDWLMRAKSSQARTKINQWFRSAEKEGNIQKGKELLVANAKAKGIEFSTINKSEYQKLVLRRYGLHDWNNVLATIGHGALKEGLVVNRMYEAWKKDHPLVRTDEDILEEVEASNNSNKENETHENKKKRKRSKSGVIVSGTGDMPVHFSRCCNPVPGDEIIGFITRGRGITIHRTDCINVLNIPEEEKMRLVEAVWEEDVLLEKANEAFETTIKIFADNRKGLLVDISKVFTEKDIDILSINTRISKTGIASITISFQIKDKHELNDIFKRIRAIESVTEVKRAMG
ncbi:MAG: bifunctional (p)ppGpp synthetase/guanosine-3',5'-bis(diphosphate) 3'-pyrophosphohydrolase [Lachnospiraceae bacterium]|nr:bifunctional (p)ppGpp synthetase/guanosine-3',5'-bis(diphosphate) 3'-pyrophosphohydrolase [Lachnospiraceae bacterium]